MAWRPMRFGGLVRVHRLHIHVSKAAPVPCDKCASEGKGQSYLAGITSTPVPVDEWLHTTHLFLAHICIPCTNYTPLVVMKREKKNKKYYTLNNTSSYWLRITRAILCRSSLSLFVYCNIVLRKAFNAKRRGSTTPNTTTGHVTSSIGLSPSWQVTTQFDHERPWCDKTIITTFTRYMPLCNIIVLHTCQDLSFLPFWSLISILPIIDSCVVYYEHPRANENFTSSRLFFFVRELSPIHCWPQLCYPSWFIGVNYNVMQSFH